MELRHALRLTRFPPPRRALQCAGRAAALGAVGALAVLTAAPAFGAQAGPEITVEAVHPLGDGSFHFIVTLADGNGDPVTGTTVTATPTNPSGTTSPAVALPSGGDGTYQGGVPLPEDGTWTVRIASADPAATIDYGFQVTGDTGTPADPVATTAPPATTAPATTATTAATTTTASTTAPSTESTTQPEPEETAAQSNDEDDDGFPVVLLIIGAALVVAIAGVPLALRTIRNSTTPTTPDGPEAPEAPEAPPAEGSVDDA